MGLLAALVADLQALGAEASKRKLPVVKEAVDRALARAKAMEAEIKPDFVIVKSGDELVRAFLLACETKNTKVAGPAIASLQKIASQNALPRGLVVPFLNASTSLMDIPEEPVQLRVLQAVVTLLTTTYELHGETLASALVVCFRLYESKTPSVASTASASLRQAVSLLFDCARREQEGTISAPSPAPSVPSPPPSPSPASQQPPSSPRPAAAAALTSPSSASPASPVAPSSELPRQSLYQVDACHLLRDLCALSGGEPATWLQLPKLPRNLGLELLEIALASRPQLYLNGHQEFVLLLKDYVCPLLVRSFKLKAEFPLLVRLNRLMLAFVRNFTTLLPAEAEVFLSRLVRVLETESLAWVQTLQLEVLRSICVDRLLLKSIYTLYDRNALNDGGRLFMNIVSTIGRFIQRMFDWADTVVVSAAKASAKPVLDALAQAEPPLTVPAPYIISLAVECLVGIADGIAKLTADVESHAAAGDTYKRMAECSWPSILAALSMLFSKSNDESFAQNILKTYQSFTLCCGSLGLRVPRDAFLTQLIKFALPTRDLPQPIDPHLGIIPDSFLSTKSLQSVKTLLNIATCMGSVLDGAWPLILEALDHLDRIVLMPAANIPPAEQAFVSSAIGNVPKSSKFLEDQPLISLLQAMVKLAQAGVSQQPMRLFGLTRLVETINVNVERLPVYWSTVAEPLLSFSEQKRENVRSSAVECFAQIVVAYTAQTAPQGDKTQQTAVLEALERLYASPYPDTRVRAHQALFQMLQSCGQCLKPWSLILSMLMTVVVNNDKLLVPVSFQSVQFVTSEFLSLLPIGCLALLVTTLSHYGSQTADINISLSAIALMWTIVDFLSQDSPAQKGDATEGTVGEKAKLWLSVFKEMKTLCLDPRSETRNCALVTLFKAVATHGPSLTSEIWSALFSQVLSPLLGEARAASERANTEETIAELGREGGKSVKMMLHHSRNTEQKQWHESQVNLVGGVARVCRTHFSALAQITDFEAYWSGTLHHIVQYCHSPARDVAAAALCALKEFMLAQSPNATFLRPYWDMAWESFDLAVRALLAEVTTTVKTLTLVVTSCAEVHNSCRAVFTDDDVARLLRVVESLGAHPGDPSSMPSLPPIQESMLKLYNQLPPLNAVQHAALIGQLLRHVLRAIGSADVSVTRVLQPKVPIPSQALFAERCITSVVSLSASSYAIKVLFTIAQVLSGAMRVKYVQLSSTLWSAAVRAFVQVVGNAPLEAVDFWAEVPTLVEEFLLHDRSNLPLLPFDAARADEALDVAIVDIVAQRLLLHAPRATPAQDTTLRLLRSASGAWAAGRELLAHAALESLFRSCAADAPDVGRLVAEAVQVCSREALTNFVADERSCGTMPLPRHRGEECYFLLSRLSALNLPASAIPQGRGPKAHLLQLYPLLCECVAARDVRLRELLIELLKKAGTEMGVS